MLINYNNRLKCYNPITLIYIESSGQPFNKALFYKPIKLMLKTLEKLGVQMGLSKCNTTDIIALEKKVSRI